jgi:glyoxylase I family protein
VEKATGIGGMFFRARDPETMARWYSDHLGVDPVPQSYGGTPWTQEAGPTAFAPFPEDTTYLGDPSRRWMINFRVRSLDAMVQQLRDAGIEVEVDATVYPNGRFAHLTDPEGNRIELWQPE